MIAPLLIGAVVGYVLASVFYLRWMLSFQTELRAWGRGFSAAAAVALAVSAGLALSADGAGRLPRSSQVVMVLTAGVGLLFVVVRFWRDVPFAGTVVAPLSAAASLAVAFKWVAAEGAAVSAGMGAITVVHVGATLLGFLLFIPAYVLSILFLDQEHHLRTKQLGESRLPGLLTLERNAWRLLYLGFPLYSVGILLGLLWQDTAAVESIQPQHVIATVSWGIYAWAIARRLRSGWRGRRAALTLMAAFVLTFSAVLLYSMR